MPDRRGRAHTQAGWPGRGRRSRCGGENKLIERAYTLGPQLGLAVWCEDEAGPFQAMPQPGRGWQPRGHPARQPHAYVREGTTKILTLFQPATGRVRLRPAASSSNAVLHGGLRETLAEIVVAPPTAGPALDPAASRATWAAWQDGLAERFTLPEDLPPLRNAAGLGQSERP